MIFIMEMIMLGMTIRNEYFFSCLNKKKESYIAYIRHIGMIENFEITQNKNSNFLWVIKSVTHVDRKYKLTD